MSLEKYLEEKGIDNITGDEVFMEAEYDAIQLYCEDHNYILEPDDIAAVRNRGFEASYECWLGFHQEGIS